MAKDRGSELRFIYDTLDEAINLTSGMKLE